jgi:predicted outer membrane protein
MNKGLFYGAFFSAILFVTGPWVVHADRDAPRVDPTKKAPAVPPLTDKQILRHLYWENQREMEADQLAQEKDIPDATHKQFEKLRKDHILFSKEILAQAGRLGVKIRVPQDKNSSETKKTNRNRAQLTKLRVLEDPEFEKQYKAYILKNHMDTIQFITDQRKLLPKDSPVYTLLGILLPKVQDHYDVISSTLPVDLED